MENKNRYLDVNHCLRCGQKLVIAPDREQKDRPQCPSCGWIYYKNAVPVVVCVVINENNEILLIKRKYPPREGKWALPSGYIEIWQTPEEAAVEELREETGLIGEIDHCIGYYYGNSSIYEKVLSLGYRMKITGGTLQAGDDALEAAFFSEAQLPEICFWAHHDYLQKEGIKLQKPKDYVE